MEDSVPDSLLFDYPEIDDIADKVKIETNQKDRDSFN